MKGLLTSLCLAANLLSPFQALAAESRPTCSPELVLRTSAKDQANPACKDLSNSPLDLRKTKDEADGVLFNYFLIGKREHRDTIKNFGRKASKSDEDRALSLAQEARGFAIRYITGNRAKQAWSEETKAIVERIEALEFRISELSDGDCYDQGDIGYPQAAYSSIDHTIGICASLAKTSSEGIFAAVTHEIGHAVSSCNMKIPLVRYKEITSEDARCALELGNHQSEISEDELRLETRQFTLLFKNLKQGLDLDPPMTDRLMKCGRAMRQANSTVQNISAFKSFDNCAMSRFSNDYKKFVAARVFNWDELPSNLSPKLQAIADKFVSENPQNCYRKTEEHFADTFSAHLVALRHEMKYSNQSSQAAQRALGEAVFDLTSTYCLGKLEGRNLSNPLLYPNDRDRVLTYLTPPYVREFLGCELDRGLCTLPVDPASFTSNTDSPKSLNRGQVR